MKKTKIILSLILVLAMTMCLTACGEKKEESSADGSFDYTKVIAENGYWKDVKALDYVELGDYSNITVNKTDINTEIAYFKQAYPAKEPDYDAVAEEGSTVNIDFIGYIDGEAFDNGSGTGYELTLGDGAMIPGFEDGILGMKPGEEKDITASFPDYYGVDELNGKDAVFHITLNYIVKHVDPEINDAFVLNNLYMEYGWSTVEDMNNGIKAQLALNSIKDASTIKEVPESMISYQTDALVAYYKQYAQAYGLEFNDFLVSYVGCADEAGLREQSYDYCKSEAEYYLFIQALAEEFGIVASEDDVKTYYEKHYADNSELTYDDFVEGLTMPYLKNVVLPTLVQYHVLGLEK